MAFATLTVAGSLLVSTAALFAADFYLHKRVERSAGLNIWGYRGALVGRKTAGEVRIAMLGGSTVFGYGVHWNEAPPAVLERELKARRGGQTALSVVNLGFNGEGAHSYLFTLDDFAWLDYDIAVLTDGYNDINGDAAPNRGVFRHKSLVFRLTGYYPITPMALHDKAAQLQARREGRVVFNAGLVARASAATIQAASQITSTLEQQVARSSAQAPVESGALELGCPAPWTTYCESMYLAVEDVLARGKRAVVVLQPRLPGTVQQRHASQQAALVSMLQRKFDGNPRVRWYDLSSAIDLQDTTLSFDRMHLTPEGIDREMSALASALAPFVGPPAPTR